ncbi:MULTISPECIES: hypothetical protein [Helicobacter]|nr:MULTISPECIES: hypothetical protein [Helicobacter]BDB64663.1 hypothetical protein T36_1120 [Helicobacter cinaedi]
MSRHSVLSESCGSSEKSKNAESQADFTMAESRHSRGATTRLTYA